MMHISKNSIIAALFLFSLCSEADSKKLEIEKTLARQGVVLSHVKLGIVNSTDEQNIRFSIHVKEPIKIRNIEIPSDSRVEFVGEFLSTIRSEGKTIKVGQYQCSGREIKFQKGNLCDCYLMESIEDNSFSLPKKSTVTFNHDKLQMVHSSSEWKYEGKVYKEGSYSINTNNTVTFLPNGYVSGNDVCKNITEDNLKKATQALKDIKVNPSEVWIVNYFYEKKMKSNGEYYDDNYIEFTTLNPIFLKKYNIPAGSRVLLMNKSIQVIILPDTQALKINQYECEGFIEFYSDTDLCSCRIAKDIVINNYKIKASSTLFFTKGFNHFLTGEDKTLPAGYYKLDNGKPQKQDSNEYDRFKCAD